MERNKKTPLLFLLLAMLRVCTVRMDIANCPSLPDKNLTCYNDYNQNITCVWNSTNVHTDAVCTLHAIKLNYNSKFAHSIPCDLQPVSTSEPALKKCSLYFKKPYLFFEKDVVSINLSCNSTKKNVTISYRPVCHVKLNPPGKPEINFTTASCFTQVQFNKKLPYYKVELQWKREDQSWSDSTVTKETDHVLKCTTELNPGDLIQGERYEARVRVHASAPWAKSTWSDWGPTASWVSPVGRTKPPLPLQQLSGVAGSVLGMIIAGAVFALFLAVLLMRNDKATWVYRKIKGSPLPDPGKSFLKDVNFQNWLSPHFTSESFHSLLKQEEIISVEVTSTADAVTMCKKEAALLEKMRIENSYESSSSSFSNPSYSHLCAPPPVPSPTTGNLEPCAAETPSGSVGSQGVDKTAEEEREEERKKELEILQLLSKGNNSEPVQVISDYEKVERHQVERLRLPSLDSGVCSGEEVSQESLEADSISATDSHDEGSEGKEQEREGGNGKVDFRMLFGGSGSVFSKGSIQVCSGYEQVPKLLPGSPELPSMDSGVCSGGEEQMSHEESLEESTESTSFQFPPPLSCTGPCSLPSFPQLPLKFSGTDLSQALEPQGPGHILEKIALMSTSRSMAPSGDGYMPVRQELS
ncbi:interleukin-2 receptor subunit beta-like isoform X1 [Trachinotus anak]|uniref:interleukin-2 receptor subunit beta-like isoform X1 n=1 Tax=Trachinotus anak TaxID=443729 RepID=UPI0039F18FEB